MGLSLEKKWHKNDNLRAFSPLYVILIRIISNRDFFNSDLVENAKSNYFA